jgi:transcription elongation factor/antiterminator RfaH
VTQATIAHDVPEPAWYAVYTRHQHEKLAAQNLERKKFEVFLPLFAATHQWKDRRKELALPLFPGYVFLHAAIAQRVELLSTPGVCALVVFAGRPAVIPEEQIGAVRRAIENEARVELFPYLRSGDRVRVTRGPLEGVEGILARARDGARRLVLSVELLQRSVAIEVDVSAVEPVRPFTGQARPVWVH